MKRIMAFGVFDFLHQGHINFLRQAKRRGAYLVVSVARDANVFEAKGRLPVFPEKERLRMVQKLDFVDEAVLGGLDNPWAHILEHKPDIIALGYDQRAYLASDAKGLEKELRKRGLETKVLRLRKYKNYKTGAIRKISGIVERHLGRGTKLGFPTANIPVAKDMHEGVFVGVVKIGARKYHATTFIGAPETFGEKKKRAETNILDFNGDLYGKRIEVELIRKIRDNKKFGSAKELINQMKKDEKFARNYFKGYNVYTN